MHERTGILCKSKMTKIDADAFSLEFESLVHLNNVTINSTSTDSQRVQDNEKERGLSRLLG